MGRVPHTALLACLLAAAATGCNYGFGMYSQALKSQFNMSQGQLDNINTIPYAFGVTSPLWGLLSRKLGTRITLVAGGLAVGTAQLSIYLVATKRVTVPSPPNTLVAIAILQYFAMAMITAPAFSVPVLHFPEQRADAIALVKSFVGLSAAVVSQTYVLFFGAATDDPKSLNCILIWMALSYLFTLTAAALIPSQPEPEAMEPRKVLRVLFWVLVVGGISTMIVSLLPYGTVHNALVPFVLLLAVLPIPTMLCYPLDPPVTPDELLAKKSEISKKTFESPNNVTILQMLQRPDAWLLWWVGSMVIGGGNMLVTHMAQIIKSAGAPDSMTATVVTVFSCCNMLGRLTCMVPSNMVVMKGHARGWFAGGLCVAMAVGHAGFLLAATMTGSSRYLMLVTSDVIAGLSFGAIWPHLVILASELYGSKNLSANYMFYDGGCGAFGTMVLANAIPDLFYKTPPGSNTCTGPHCYSTTHLCIIGLNLTGCVAAAAISLRSTQLYRDIRDSHMCTPRAEGLKHDLLLAPEEDLFFSPESQDCASINRASGEDSVPPRPLRDINKHESSQSCEGYGEVPSRLS
eukprot:TRINITY_DN29122_c0_g1_i2.p1 TRINITY_DN29122_c0_g1~~TRINITY_DN29122_c0_g1_i2.p1  ORF type:complete len:574 (-),score=109.27 TRINITY_DN29122_c0_g1_i2:256-1977(-)